MSYSWHIVGVFVDSALNVEKNSAQFAKVDVKQQQAVN